MAAPSHYLVIIDAAHTSTRVHVFEWDGNETDPSTLHEVDLGNYKQHLESKPALHNITTPDRIALAVHFSPMIKRMKFFFAEKQAPSEVSPVHIFVFGSGLRHVASPLRDQLLNSSYAIIKDLCPDYKTGESAATNALIPTEHDKSALTWAGVVYGRHLTGNSSVSQIPSSRAGRKIATIPQGDHLLLQLEHKDWGRDLPLLSSSHWEAGAAALIIINQMSTRGSLTTEDRLPLVEFTVHGEVRIKNSTLAHKKPLEVETILGGNVGVPNISDATMLMEKDGFSILRPEFFLMAKLKRWEYEDDSTNPDTILILIKDAMDILFLIGYLNKPHWRGMVSFKEYKTNVTQIRQKLIRISANFFLEKSKEGLGKEKDNALSLFKGLLVPKDLMDFEAAMRDTQVVRRAGKGYQRSKWGLGE
ncbi:hypothetical protein H0H87_004689 [Tephrocybe sp. NHM501043]|nr:hypothetical protein H0H87_004689 [Tephrocybe sp. NHM501043]